MNKLEGDLKLKVRPDLDALSARAKRARMGRSPDWHGRPACYVPVDDVLWLVERVRQLESAHDAASDQLTEAWQECAQLRARVVELESNVAAGNEALYMCHDDRCATEPCDCGVLRVRAALTGADHD